MSNGVRLGWLIDPYQELVWIYRADGSVEQLDRPKRSPARTFVWACRSI